MPNGNGTGPQGKGSRTGRGLGTCPPARKTTSGQRKSSTRTSQGSRKR